jgi:hypothetical protein
VARGRYDPAEPERERRWLRLFAFLALAGGTVAWLLRRRPVVPLDDARRVPESAGAPESEPGPQREAEMPAAPGPRAGDPGDTALADRVRSEVFRDRRFKGTVNVAAEHGRVVLHGELESPDLIGELVSAVRRVEGVRDVVSRVRLPHVAVQLPKRPPT